MSRAVTILTVLALVSGLAGAAAATTAVADQQWRLEQPAAPAAPAGVEPAPFPVPLGHVGGMAFTAPNRGALITAGNGPVSAGVYAYDGVTWHQLSTVCGARDGAVAWAGQSDLWVVADGRVGQTGPGLNDTRNNSLCHIAGGRVVASYAQPADRPDSYQAMDAAACLAPDDCWFGGGLLLLTPPYGAFHLRWDGQSVTAVPSAVAPVNNDPAHAIRAIATHQGTYFESVRIAASDPVNPAAPSTGNATAWFNVLTPDLSAPFVPVPVVVDLGRTPTNVAVRPIDLDGFALSSDGERLWAVAGSTSTRRANVIVLQLQPSGSFKQLKLVAGPGVTAALPAGSQVTSVAAEPGTGAAWIAYRAPGATEDVAQVARVDASGTITRADTLPGADDPVGPKGAADQIACPAAGDCWLTTTDGWLFHLSDGTSFPRDTDPSWAGVITDRPADGGTPFQQPVELPIDDSLANLGTALPTQAPPVGSGPAGDDGPAPRPKPLVTKVKTSMVKHTTTLRVTFQLAARARVTVVAKRRGKTVAKSKTVTLKKGKRTVSLRLNRRKWPTALAIDAKAVQPASAARSATALRVPALTGATR